MRQSPSSAWFKRNTLGFTKRALGSQERALTKIAVAVALFLSVRASDRRSVSVGRRRNASNRSLRRHQTMPSQATDHGVENRGEEHSEECDADHAEEYDRAESLSHFGTGTGDDDGLTLQDSGHAQVPQKTPVPAS